jgi:hypothetical protein
MKPGSRIGKNYTIALQKSHIHLSENLDELAWSFPQSGGSYSTKLNYTSLMSREEENPTWWYRMI